LDDAIGRKGAREAKNDPAPGAEAFSLFHTSSRNRAGSAAGNMRGDGARPWTDLGKLAVRNLLM
jgi:hypothetical protein